ncbi:MAG: glycosyltransferase family 2 protein, partial [Acidimicrobiales bacterium]
MTGPRVGIVVATFRGERTLPATLASIRAQTFPDWACCIVDDGSDDSTRHVACALTAGDPRFTTLAQDRSGTSAARNRGLGALPPTVEYVTFLDQDDLWEPDAIA